MCVCVCVKHCFVTVQPTISVVVTFALLSLSSIYALHLMATQSLSIPIELTWVWQAQAGMPWQPRSILGDLVSCWPVQLSFVALNLVTLYCQFIAWKLSPLTQYISAAMVCGCSPKLSLTITFLLLAYCCVAFSSPNIAMRRMYNRHSVAWLSDCHAY